MTKTRSAMPTVVPPRAGRVAAVAVALVAALAPRPAAVQTSGDVGVTIAPAFLHYLDVDPVCCPASVWGAVGSGRWRAHVDYLRSTREDATLHEVNVLAAWRFLERDDSRAALLFGTNIRRGIRHQVRATLDWPVGRRFFVRVDALFSVNYFCRLASTIFAGSGRRESRSTTMTPVGRVGVACDVQSGVENALPRRCTVAPLLARVFHAAGAVHRLLGFRSIPAFRRSTVGGRGAAADPEHVPGEQAPRGISGGTGPCGSSGRRTQACSA